MTTVDTMDFEASYRQEPEGYGVWGFSFLDSEGVEITRFNIGPDEFAEVKATAEQMANYPTPIEGIDKTAAIKLLVDLVDDGLDYGPEGDREGA